MASRTAACAFSLAGTIGSRSALAHLPISDSAYLIGRWVGFHEQIDVQWRELVLQLERGGKITFQTRGLEFGAEPGRDV